MTLIFHAQRRPHIWLKLKLAVDQSVVLSAFGGNFSGLLDYTAPLFTLVGDAEPTGFVL